MLRYVSPWITQQRVDWDKVDHGIMVNCQAAVRGVRAAGSRLIDLPIAIAASRPGLGGCGFNAVGGCRHLVQPGGFVNPGMIDMARQ